MANFNGNSREARMKPIKSIVTSVTNKDISLKSKKAFVPESEDLPETEVSDGEN